MVNHNVYVNMPLLMLSGKVRVIVSSLEIEKHIKIEVIGP